MSSSDRSARLDDDEDDAPAAPAGSLRRVEESKPPASKARGGEQEREPDEQESRNKEEREGKKESEDKPNDKPTKEEKKRLKQLKKQQKAVEDSHRPLDAWERYRALNDAFDMEQELVDLADHKARFALMIMGALNAATFILGTRSESIIPEAVRPWVAGYVGVYALVALYFFMQAIESLRPRGASPNIPYPGAAGLQDHPVGVRFFEDILNRDVESYRQAWRELHIGQLNAEVAIQVHIIARINRAKYRALRRLYLGLQIMTLLTAGLIVFLAACMIAAPSTETTPSPPVARRTIRPAALLGAPTRIAPLVAREPSGIAYHAALDRLFVVGDEGTLAELDPSGRVEWSGAVKGDLEDVAVYTPSGSLVLLLEKQAQLVWFDPVAHVELKKWRLDTTAVLGRAPGDSTEGFEGLAFREEAGKPGGGVFYLAHRRDPAMLVALAFDPEMPAHTLGAESVLTRWSIDGYRDLTAVTYQPSLDRLIVVSDGKDRLALLKTDGTPDAEVILPGLQQEGACVDRAGTLWVADDRGGLLKFQGALETLKGHLNAAEAAPPSKPVDPLGVR